MVIVWDVFFEDNGETGYEALNVVVRRVGRFIDSVFHEDRSGLPYANSAFTGTR